MQPLDNSPLNLKIAASLAEALRKRGVAVADDAPLVLEFETATEDTTVSPPRRGTLAEPRRVDIGRERDLGRGDAVDARVDLYSNTRNSVLTGVRRSDPGLRYVLRATLGERVGARLWEGYARNTARSPATTSGSSPRWRRCWPGWSDRPAASGDSAPIEPAGPPG